MKIYKRILSLLLCVLLVTMVSISVSAGSAVDLVTKETFAESLSTSYWHNANEDVIAENGKIIFGKDTSEYTKLISKIAAEESNYYENVLKGKTVINFKSLPSGVTFIMAFALASVESGTGEPGNVEIEFTNKGGVSATVKSYDENGTEKVLANSRRVGSFNQELTLDFACAADGKLTLLINGASVCNAVQTGSDFFGRFGFMQNGTTNIEVSDVDVTIYNYDAPENVNIDEDFNDGEFDTSKFTVVMNGVSKFPATASIGEHKGQNALLWKNCSNVVLSTRYAYSNVEVSYDVLWQQNSLDVKDDVVLAQPTSAHSLRFGCDSMNFNATAGFVLSFGSGNKVTGTGGSEWKLNSKDFLYSNPENASKGYSVKVTMINNVVTIYLKWLNDTEYFEVGHIGKEDGVTPSGFVQLYSGSNTNIILDNLKITNLDAKPNLVEVEYKSNRFIHKLKDFEYTPEKPVYMDAEDTVENAGFNFYLITLAAVAVGVLGVATVFVVMIIKKKKANKAVLAQATEPAISVQEDEKAGETADE